MLYSIIDWAKQNPWLTLMIVGSIGTGLFKFLNIVAKIVHHAIDAKNGTDYSGKYYSKSDDDDDE